MSIAQQKAKGTTWVVINPHEYSGRVIAIPISALQSVLDDICVFNTTTYESDVMKKFEYLPDTTVSLTLINNDQFSRLVAKARLLASGEDKAA